MREVGDDQALAFHLLPVGNCTIRARTHGIMHNTTQLLIELAPSDEDLRLVLFIQGAAVFATRSVNSFYRNSSTAAAYHHKDARQTDRNK
jgi:hypothetical protein